MYQNVISEVGCSKTVGSSENFRLINVEISLRALVDLKHRGLQKGSFLSTLKANFSKLVSIQPKSKSFASTLSPAGKRSQFSADLGWVSMSSLGL